MRRTLKLIEIFNKRKPITAISIEDLLLLAHAPINGALNVVAIKYWVSSLGD